jgi:acetylornithine/N-succinyldiaminopimelate aminotransferase
MTHRQLFLQHNAQTSTAPLAIEMVKAEGCRMWDADGKEYLDIIGGISVCNVGHRHPKVIEAIQLQLEKYLHIMVYGELVQNPQVQYAKLLTDHLPASLNAVYFTSSGTEATEGAMKLAKRITSRTEMVSFNNSYHGSTQGALSVMGDEYWRNTFRPLLPGIHHANYNSFEALDMITTNTACVIAETIQAEAGVNAPLKEWIIALRNKCTQTGTLLILDEIQCGFGRNGTLWVFEQFGIVPDILLLGKALGGGMPLGAFIADKKLMDSFSDKPVLGHITTFGGHPVCCAAGMAAMNVLLEEKLVDGVYSKEQLFRSLLHHPKIKAVRSRGLMIAVEFENFEQNKQIIDACIEAGVFTDWFLFASHCMRIAPPLMISEEEIRKSCSTILSVLNRFS